MTKFTPPTITKQDVVRALASLYVNRSKRDGFQYVRSILQRYGDGAANINKLKKEFYSAVYAAVTIPTLAEFYGTVTDVQAAPQAQPVAPVPLAPSRVRSPLTIELEARLAERAGKPRSKPGGRVDYGNPAHFGDQADDVVRDFPAGERVR